MAHAPGPARAAAAFVASLALVAVPSGAIAAPPPANAAKVLHDKGSGLSVTAPKGATLARKGKRYVVTTKRLRVTLSRVGTKQAPAAAAGEIARALGAVTSNGKGAKSAWRGLLTPRAGGSASALAIRRSGKKALIVGLARGRGQAAATGAAATESAATESAATESAAGAGRGGPLGRAAALTAADLAALAQLVGSATGGATAALGGPLPLRQYVAPDGGASAFVPDRPGWTFSGGNGIVEGTNLNEGAFAFGVSFPVALPTPFPSQLLVSPYLDAAGTLTQVLPAFFQRAGGQLTVTRATPFAGSEQILGGGISSSFFAVEATSGGTPFDGVFLVGSLPSLDGSFWYVYYSFAMVRRGADPRLGPALLDTWASWNPSVDRQRRVNQTIQTILSTNVGGGPIDQDVFDAAAAKWGEYIRE